MNLAELQKLSKNTTDPTTMPGQEQLREELVRLGIDPSGYYQELEMSSQYVNTHRDVSFSSTTVNLHSHTFF